MPVPRPGPPPKPPILEKVVPRTGHRVAAVLLLALAGALVLQVLMMAFISDESLLATLHYVMRRERDKRMFEYVLNHRPVPSDAEVDALVEEHKEEMMREMRSVIRGSAGGLGSKGVVAILLGVVAVGLLRGRSRPTRVLAGLSAVLLIVGSVIAILTIEEAWDALIKLGNLQSGVDFLIRLLAPLAGVTAFVVAGRRLWLDGSPPGAPRTLGAVRPRNLPKGPSAPA